MKKDRIKITEEENYQKKWYKESKDQTLESLQSFVLSLVNDYDHDYGTIVHAMTAAAIATIDAMDKSEQGGITGFQASCITWKFINEWHGYNHPMKLLHFNKMLYPQYEYDFQKTIPKEAWLWLQKESRKNLNDKLHCSLDVADHWKNIANGKVPFGYTVEEND